MHSHTPTQKTDVQGGCVLRAGSGVTSETLWKSRELMVGDMPQGCTWQHLLLFIYVVILIFSLYIFSYVCISIWCLSPLLKAGSGSVVELRSVILHVSILSSFWACQNLTKQILEKSLKNWTVKSPNIGIIQKWYYICYAMLCFIQAVLLKVGIPMDPFPVLYWASVVCS